MSRATTVVTDRLERPREPWFLRSRLRLYAVLVIALAIPGLALSVFVALDVKSELRAQAELDNRVDAKTVARTVKAQFDGLKSYVRSYADRIKFSEAVSDQDAETCGRHLVQMVAKHTIISRAFIADTNGVIWIDSPSDPKIIGRSFAHRDWFKGLAHGQDVYISEIYRRQAFDQPYTIAVSAKVLNSSGRYCGILVAQITVEDLCGWFTELEFPKDRTMALVDQSGHWLDNNHGLGKESGFEDTTSFSALLRPHESSIEAADPNTGVASLIDAVAVPSHGWSVIARRRLDTVDLPLRALQKTIVLYFTIGLLGMILIGGTMYRVLRSYDSERNRSEEALRAAYQDVESQVRRRTAELTEANREMSRLVEIIRSTSDAIGSASLEGMITSWNPAAEQMYGYSSDEIVGRPAEILLPEDRLSETRGVIDRVIRGESVPPFESIRRRKDGSLFHGSLVYSPVRDDHDNLVGVSVVVRDITRQKEIEAQAYRLERERVALLKRLQMTFDRMPIGCILNDTEFRFTYWNPAAERIFGYTFDEVKGQHPFSIITPESAQSYVAGIFKRLAEGGEDVDAVGENCTKDGRRITCVWNNSSLRDNDGRFLGIISMCQDVTVQKRDEERLKLYAAALAQNNRELQDFAFVASHDLQEPLRKIVAFGERLEDSSSEALSEESRDYLDRMQRAAQRMQTLMNDLLDFSRVTTRAQPFVATDLNAVAAEVVSDLDTRIEQTGGRVEVGALPVIEADRVQMRQLLQNLIANALKFHRRDVTPVVRVTAMVSPAPSGAGSGMCELIVEDNGIGFEQKYLDRIFTPFQRLHGRSEYEGTGMGLAICRKIAERHSGSVTAISTPGKGSSFIVTMPLKQPEAGSTLWTQREGPSASFWPTTTPTTAS